MLACIQCIGVISPKFLLINVIVFYFTQFASSSISRSSSSVQTYLIDTIPKITVFTSANQQQIALSYQLIKTNDF